MRTGNVKLIKTSEGGIVSGLTFNITGDGVDRTVTTGDDGTFLSLKSGVSLYLNLMRKQVKRRAMPPSRGRSTVSTRVTSL